MTTEISEVLQRVVDKASKVANRNAELQSKVKELEEQIDHLQETLAALQAEHVFSRSVATTQSRINCPEWFARKRHLQRREDCGVGTGD